MAVDLEISYESKTKGAREYAVKIAVENFPIDEVGFHTKFGRYTVKRGDRRLVEVEQ